MSLFFCTLLMTKQPRLVLASRSPRRQLLLKQIGLTFAVKPSRVREVILPAESPSVNAKRIALEKARDVGRQLKKGIIIGADTIVVVGRQVLGKPKSRKDAKRMLLLLSGRSHYVYTGFALLNAASGKHVSDVVRTKVWFRRLSQREIDQYVKGDSPMDKAGAYGIQDDYGAVFVERVEGCFYNVVGFPLSRFYVVLKRFLGAR